MTKRYIENLVKQYGYKPLPPEVKIAAMKVYLNTLPEVFDPNSLLKVSKASLYSPNLKVKISNGFKRIVVGDYGAYIEIDSKDICIENLEIKKGQEWRLTDQYKGCKYEWWVPKGDPDIKIYKQKNTVAYADYKKGMWYVSVYDVVVGGF